MFFILEAGFIFKPQAIRQKDYHQAIRLSLDGKVCQSQIERSPTGPSRKFPSAGGGRSPPADCSGEIKRTRWESGKAAFAFPISTALCGLFMNLHWILESLSTSAALAGAGSCPSNYSCRLRSGPLACVQGRLSSKQSRDPDPAALPLPINLLSSNPP